MASTRTGYGSVQVPRPWVSACLCLSRGESTRVGSRAPLRGYVWALVVATVVLGTAACGGRGPLTRLIRIESPYERYVETLRATGLADTALGRDWIRAGSAALEAPVAAQLPFRETGYFPPDAPSAAAYRLHLQRGRQLVVDVAFESAAPARLFVDLFEATADTGTAVGGATLPDTSAAHPAPRLVASRADDSTTLIHDVVRDGDYLLRVQPERLRGGRYTIVERTLSTLAFPVSGLTARAVQSGFGAARDSGVREHEGVDIFAARGTSVVAVADGIARTDTNGLGGNVVWLHQPASRTTFYYAHLDGWAIAGTKQVRAGDVLGFVGNTGNARTTAPHLHFGVYARDAIDPLPFLQPDDPVPPEPGIRDDRLGVTVRVVARRAELRAGAHRGAATIRVLPRASIARVLAVTARSYRVSLPDRTVGYLATDAVTPLEPPLRRDVIAAGSALRESPDAAAPVKYVVPADARADVLGEFGAFVLVRMGGATTGWVQRTDAGDTRTVGSG